jgi:hypothetical protein
MWKHIAIILDGDDKKVVVHRLRWTWLLLLNLVWVMNLGLDLDII